jgi:hypothetical protein
MEKAFLMATHKAIDPPVNAPARMRGKLSTLPGAKNYYSNPQETVEALYQMRFDFSGVSAAVERVEQRIQRNFFNDIFLTAARDPNASPLKATQVTVQEQEKMLRLGPVIERMQYEFLHPVIERCFNIMLRKGRFLPLDPALAEMAGDFDIKLVSPLATAQRGVALQGINSFLAFVGQAAQFSPSAMDRVNIDATVDEYADITGVNREILNSDEMVAQIRQQRQQQQQAEMQRQQQLEQAEVGAQSQAQSAQAQKTQAEATKTMVEAQQMQQEMGAV